MEYTPEVRQWHKRASDIASVMVDDAIRMLHLISTTDMTERQLMVKLHNGPREPLELAVLASHPTLSRTAVVKLNKHQLIEKLLDRLQPQS